MGNTLCKERGDNMSRSPKSPVDRVLSRFAQICPNASSNKSQTYWHKHVFETSPPTKKQPQKMNINDGWHNTTLKVSQSTPISTDPNYPIAPPRRKRSSLALSTILVPDENKPGGFKEVFGDLTKQSKRSDSDLSLDQSFSNGFTDFTRELSNESTSTINNANNDIRSLKRKISKVGNKKSDKFFGENLSDCLSDEPIIPSSDDSPILSSTKIDETLLLSSGYESQLSDALDEFVDKNVKHDSDDVLGKDKTITNINDDTTIIKAVEQRKLIKMTEQPPPPPPPPLTVNVEVTPNTESASSVSSNDKRSSMDKRAEFLMTLLEGYNKDTESTLSTVDQNSETVVVAPKRKQNKENLSQEDIILSDIEKQIKPISNTSSVTKTEKRVNFVVQEKMEKQSASIDETDFYSQMKPVDEPLIVPKRKVYKHICHEDDHIHDAINAHKLESLDAEHNIANNSPKKPARDFSKYGKSKTLPNGMMKNLYTEQSIEKPIRRNRKNISRDKLPTPPPTPINNNTNEPTAAVVATESAVALTNDAAIPNDILSTVNDMNDKKNSLSCKKPVEASLRKCNSSQSFLTNDKMADIVHKVYEFDFDWNEYDDGSTHGLPVSKVTTRKISASRQEREKSEEMEKTQNNFADTNPFKSVEPILQVNNNSEEIAKSNDKLVPSLEVDERQHAIEAKEIEKLAEFSIGGTDINVTLPNFEKRKIVVNDFLDAERKFSMDTFPAGKLHLVDTSSDLNSSNESIPSTVETVIMNPLINSQSSLNGFDTKTDTINAIEMSKNPSGTNDVSLSNGEVNNTTDIGQNSNKRRLSEYAPSSKYEHNLSIPRRSLDSCDKKQLQHFVVPEIKITTDADTSNAADHSVLLKYFNEPI